MTVAQRFTPLTVSTPAGTTVAAPQSTALNLGDVVLDRLFWRIPPGPSALCGAAVYQAGTQLWPWGASGTYLVGDDEYDDVPIGTEVGNGITIVTYNLDIYPHSWYFKFLYTPIALATSSVQNVPIVAIS